MGAVFPIGILDVSDTEYWHYSGPSGYLQVTARSTERAVSYWFTSGQVETPHLKPLPPLIRTHRCPVCRIQTAAAAVGEPLIYVSFSAASGSYGEADDDDDGVAAAS